MDAMLVDAQIIRLYKAFFDRKPDQTGFDYWHDDLMSQALSLQDTAQAFSQSNEFSQRYGNLDNSQFLTLVYQQVLGRTPDTEGFNYWLNELDQGSRRGDMMVGFSESREHIASSTAHTAISQLELEKTANATPKFQQAKTIPLITGNDVEESSAVATLDLNGDGLLDVINARSTTELNSPPLKLDLFLNQGEQKFVSAELSGFISGPSLELYNTSEILKADFNADGVEDLLIADQGTTKQTFIAVSPFTLLLSEGVNHWENVTAMLPSGLSPSKSLASGDIDKDGDLDILVAAESSHYFLLNNGQGLFTKADTPLPQQLIAIEQTSVYLADFNNDGAADMVIGGNKDTAPYVVYNDGNGLFKDQLTVNLPQGDSPAQKDTLDIQSLDVNGDGWLDMIIAETSRPEIAAYDGNRIQILVNQKGNGFIDETDIRLLEQSSSLLKIPKLFIDDLNGDGYQDILAEQTGDYYLNDGKGVFASHAIIANYQEGDGPFVLADLDHNGNVELIVTGVAEANYYQ